VKILIVDDESIVRRSLRRAAESRGHQVFEANDGEQCLQLWKSSKPDLVFLDVLMPGLTGPQVLEEISDRGGAKVVLMSAYTGTDEKQKKSWPSYDLFIPKPFENIFEVIERAERL
jgi:two-component system, response regulator PdtaR